MISSAKPTGARAQRGRWRRLAAIVLVLSGSAAPAWAAAESYQAGIEAARATRVARLITPDGWLSLIGLHFLEEGTSRVGSAAGNDVRLTAGPPQLGVVTLNGGQVTFSLASGVDGTVGGDGQRSGELRTSQAGQKPTLMTSGTVSLFAIERGGKKALRVKDSASKRRAEFVGLDYFPIDPAWRIEARWEIFERARLLPITNMLGQTAPVPVPGRAVFERDGRTYELLPVDEGRDVPLFFVISDATSGRETYGASRFLYVDWPKEGARTIVLDFNLAENPPCAFTPFATCPLPPKENRLPFAVTAGEKDYRGAHD